MCVGRERAGFLTLSLASSKVHINNEAWEKEKKENKSLTLITLLIVLYDGPKWHKYGTLNRVIRVKKIFLKKLY